MRFCVECDRVMTADTSTGNVIYDCVCGNTEPGGDEDVLIFSSEHSATTTTPDMYQRLILTAAMDVVNRIVMKECELCGLDYMTAVTLSDAMAIIYICKCGNRK